DGQVGIADLLAPLRYRSSQLLEAAGIDSYWHLHGVDELELDGPRGLDLLRLLQEALTNVFKHSRATRVDVSLSHEDGRLRLDVRDDGGGLSTFVHRPGGAGLTSMRLRANRLGGELQIDSTEQGTRLQVGFPLTRAARLGRSG
ncbi:sensor histidine kinase, partial [Lysobacter sp. 2RAB21]